VEFEEFVIAVVGENVVFPGRISLVYIDLGGHDAIGNLGVIKAKEVASLVEDGGVLDLGGFGEVVGDLVNSISENKDGVAVKSDADEGGSFLVRGKINEVELRLLVGRVGQLGVDIG